LAESPLVDIGAMATIRTVSLEMNRFISILLKAELKSGPEAKTAAQSCGEEKLGRPQRKNWLIAMHAKGQDSGRYQIR
jgi:hypothetical protein